MRENAFLLETSNGRVVWTKDGQAFWMLKSVVFEGIDME
jgi:hypothetical protein